jgi:hypothetical protein
MTKQNKLTTSARPLALSDLNDAEAAQVNGGRRHKKHHPIFGLLVNPGTGNKPIFGLMVNPNSTTP